MAYTRRNFSTRATIDVSKVFGSGSFKLVYAGTYKTGQRKGQSCVAKEFKSGSVVEEHYFEEELNICAKAQEIINEFNEAEIIEQEIHPNKPEIWTYTGGRKSGQKNLVEPMITNFEKFNSNSGWVKQNSNGWTVVMQALSHFSYHNSGGEYLLCDLQGGRYSDGCVLSDPVIMSKDQDCGPADLGMDGIMSFFQRHRCGEYCESSWSKPPIIGKARIPMTQGTSMQAYLTTGRTRLPLSRAIKNRPSPILED
ncbi:hypothetical protein H072_6459 [Dactylellina haptotyla CBS 200.50]|uniref:Alpha-type protein kinase domain-containing protein n=1 Tax=Dactylellina haptotyla (strain CBS 200.50) TaxID=1284197 RepID=S8AF35_DACHA|nr:hypothetical protein H072_6459 [Dactylellina haptotyla CBS 200.50]